jgi:cysteine sulfinate desulfinase/cysteine desulfurase-like protein
MSVLCASAEKCYKKNLQSTPMSRFDQDKMTNDAKEYILKNCNAPPDQYSVFFTSSEIESNTIILCCAVNAYKKIRKKKPHIVISSAEHNSIITYTKSLFDSDQIDLTIVKSNSYGCVLSDDIIGAVKPTTCMVSTTYINHELGSVNNIAKISSALHEKRIPLHSDCTYLFGKHALDLSITHMDAATVSFDKINGPVGVSALIINNDFLDGYKLADHSATLAGNRSPNLPAIAAAMQSLRITIANRKTKNKKLLKLRNDIITKLSSKYQTLTFANFMKSDEPPLEKISKSNRMVILGPPPDNTAYYTPGILSILMISNKKKTNKDIKQELEKRGIVIGIPDLTYMYKEMGIPDEAQDYIIRISLSDQVTQDNVDEFVKTLKNII